MFLDEQIDRLRRRIKSIDANPHPEFLKSNRLRYEMELETYLAVLDDWKSGKPFAALDGAEQLTAAMGFTGVDYDEWGDRVTAAQRYRDIVLNQGFPEHTCDRTLTRLGLFLSGEVPIARIIIGRRTACDPERWSPMAMAKYGGTLLYEVDKLNTSNYDNIRYVADQIGGLIEFCEKSIPGIRYDESRLIEVLEMEHQSHRYLQETYEARKKVPCPIAPQDSFRLSTLRAQFVDLAKAVEYRRMYRDELFERAAKGIGGVPEEKLRIAWLATGPYGRSTFDLLTRKGVSIPWFHYGVAPWIFGIVRDEYGDDSYGRKLTPLEELVRFRTWNSNVWSGTGDMWVNSLMKACVDLKIDAVVDFLQPGCITTKNLKRITAQRLRDELGIPTLDLEGREFFATVESLNEMNRKLEDFLDVCIANKTGSHA